MAPQRATKQVAAAAIAARLRERMRDGTYPAGSMLPPYSELSEEFGVSALPVGEAVKRLAEEGLVEPAPGKRYRVRGERPLVRYHAIRAGAPPQLDYWTSDVLAIGDGDGQPVLPTSCLEVSIPAPPPHVASLLDLPDPPRVVRREELRAVNNRPVMACTLWVPRKIAIESARLMEPEDLPDPLQEFAAIGHPVDRLVDQVDARLPTDEEAAMLQLQAGAPVMVVLCTGYSKDKPVLVVETIAAGTLRVYERTL